MTTLSIIILNYNTKELTYRCIRSVIAQYKKEIESNIFEIIVVDNASKDNPYEGLADFKLTFIRNKENYGFGKGNNIGAKKAKGKYILFLNSDTEVKNRGFLDMVTFLDANEKVGILGGKVTNEDGSVQKSAGKFYTLSNIFLLLFGFSSMLRINPTKTSRIDWVSGASLMIRKTLFEKLRGFDEHFFMYIEDMDLCLRAKKVGFLVYFFPHVSIFHEELGSSNRTFAILHIYKGILYFFRKHFGYTEYIFAKFLLLLKAFFAIVVGVCTANRYLISTYRKAFVLTLQT